MHRYKKRISIIILLLLVMIACGIIGQYNVRKSLFKLSEDFNFWAMDIDGTKCLFIDNTPTEGEVALSNSFVTLEFQYEFIGMSSITDDMNLHIDIYSVDMPDNVFQWEFANDTMDMRGNVSIDIKAFKGKNIKLRLYSKGNFPDNGGIQLNSINLSKLYIGE